MAVASVVGIVGLFAPSASAQLTGDTGAHDPSTLIKDGSTYYYFATGQGIVTRSSTDKVNWTTGPAIFGTPPAWTTAAVSGFTGDFWAPDVGYFNGTYHVYYAASSWGTIDSAIGVVTSNSLTNPVWTDQGKVVQSDAVGYTQSTTDTTAFNAIDPSILVDSGTNKVWMSWGSYSSGIVVSEIDPSTGKRLNTSSVGTMVANNSGSRGWGSSIEGSALVKHGGYYYLFVNYGTCCSGVNSTYNVRVGRSASPTGPFVDKSGVDMRDGGGSMFLQDDGKMIGPGHFSYYTENGQDQFGYHYYNGDANGAPTYGLHNLYWTGDAWPSYAAVNPDWTGTTNNGWSTAANWSGGVVPNGVGQVANFGSNTSGTYVISLDGSGRTLGSVNFSGVASYTIGTTGHVLTLDADTGYAATVNVAAGNHTIASPISAVDNLGVNVTPAASTLTFFASVTAPQLTKYGHGTLSLGGVNTYSGSVLDRWGTLDITGSVTASAFTSIAVNVGETAAMTLRGNGSFTANADFNVGDTGDAFTAAAGTLSLSGSASLTVNTAGGFFVGSGYFGNTQAVGTVNQSGGTLTANGNFDGAFIIGGRGSALAVGTYNLSGGAVNANTNVRVGGYGHGTINQTNGAFNSPSYLSIGRYAGAVGAWNISGGAINQTNAARSLIVGEAGTGTLTVSGSGQVVLGGSLKIGSSNTGVGVVNLNGGSILTPLVTRGTGSATFNFNGGTLRSANSGTTFMQGLTAANVKAGGATIDTQGYAVTVAQPLLHDTTLGTTGDGGLAKIGTGTLTLTGANTYTGPTTVVAGTLKVKYAATGVSAASPLLSGAGGADVQNGQVVFDYTGTSSPAAAIRSLLATADAGNFAAGQLRSTAATATRGLGYKDDGASQVTVMATLYGDADLDGGVSINDFNALAANFGKTGQVWKQGDFDYDGGVSINDFNLLAANFGKTLGSPSDGPNFAAVSLWDFAVAHDDQAAFIAATGVPEPASVSLIATTSAVLFRRRRKSRTAAA